MPSAHEADPDPPPVLLQSNSTFAVQDFSDVCFIQEELIWWEVIQNLSIGILFPTPPHQLVLTMDDSMMGWELTQVKGT